MFKRNAGSYTGNGAVAAGKAERCLCALGGSGAPGSRLFCVFKAISTAALILCLLAGAAGCARTSVHSDAGKTELETLVRLRIIDPENVPEPDAEVTAYGLAGALERLTGAGDYSRAADYFRNFSLSYDVDFYRTPSGSVLEPEAKIAAVQLYSACLQVLVYDPFAAYEGAQAAGNTAGNEAVLALAKSAGFGYYSEVLDAKTVTYGKLALALYELLLLKAGGQDRAVYMWLGDLDSSFRSLLINNGLYDDIPAELAPRFSAGMYLPGTFFAAVKSGAGSEWQAAYARVDEAQLAAYFARLEAEGWTLETELNSETEPGTRITLYYKPYASGTDGEMGLTVKYSENGALDWYLMA